MAEKKGCDGVICGHIHHPEDRIINGKRYLNSGDWVENMSAILINNEGNIKIYKY
jgi:UDP-2,3-diacylglucosamine pyrophosphatase LpxH